MESGKGHLDGRAGLTGGLRRLGAAALALLRRGTLRDTDIEAVIACFTRIAERQR
ncbi:hypothetical protein FRZ61_37910 [Hypericibacter adhaerens]|jgi:hypothetical protein|uniref:Uncharacterized protein n=1 Tax=Hypericibacter adhaerens TaxID=2602016 RepID=A0A5J6N1H8_9PROT|nr:hypothetical protein [Hypericibacter adhaerens]QEX23852.1 hypothetical protein FRZ61_37910 [Hypericibacter adhaerens]